MAGRLPGSALKRKFAVFLRAARHAPRSVRSGQADRHGPDENKGRPHLPNRPESPIRHGRLQPPSGPMKFPRAAVASTLALAMALAWLTEGTVSLASPKSIPLPRPRPSLVARGESAVVTPVALQSKLSAPSAAATVAPGSDLGTVKQA